MRKLVYLIRHAKSDWTTGVKRDFDRPLNARGQRDAPVMAALLDDLGVKPDLIVTSPALRALTTARVFQERLQISPERFILQERIYEATPRTILEIIQALPENVHTVLLFGHNMTFTELKHHFDPASHENVPTCGIVMLEGEMEHWSEFNYPRAKCVRMWKPKDAEY